MKLFPFVRLNREGNIFIKGTFQDGGHDII